MKKIRLFTICLLSFVCFFLNAQVTEPSQGYVLHGINGLPAMVLNLDQEISGNTLSEICSQYLETNKNWITQGQNSTFKQAKFLADSGSTHLVFQHVINNIPVDGSVVIITLNKLKKISMVYNSFKLNVSDPGNAFFDSTQAESIAVGALPFIYTTAYQQSNKELIIKKDSSENARLIWKVDIFPANNNHTQVFVNAITGSVESLNTIGFNINPPRGKIWDPDPCSKTGSLYGDNYLGVFDADRPTDAAFQTAYKVVDLQGLNGPKNENGIDYYYLRGEYAYSKDIKAPLDAVTKVTIQPGKTEPEFYFNRSQNGFEETNIYYHIDTFLRYINGTLHFYPTWNNSTLETKKDMVFDARYIDYTFPGHDQSYYDGTGTTFYGVPETFKDHGEDESVILHEVGHAIHTALLGSGTPQNSHDAWSISEGIGDYFGIDYRRQNSFWHPNHRAAWLYLDYSTAYESVFENGYYGDFSFWSDDWDVHYNGKIWTSALMGLEYNISTNPAAGIKLSRDVVMTNLLTAISSVTGYSTVKENVLAMYNSDLTNVDYQGLHLREYIDNYSMDKRKLFNDQKITGNITSSTWAGYKLINGDVHLTSGNLQISNNAVVVMNGKLFIDASASLTIGNNVQFIGYDPSHVIIVNGNIVSIGNNLKCTLAGNASGFGGFSFDGNTSAYPSVTLNYAVFNKAGLTGNFTSLNAKNCQFNECNPVITNRGNITFENCTFYNTQLLINNVNYIPNTEAKVLSNSFNFTSPGSNVAVYIAQYSKFDVSSNNIIGAYRGLRFFGCGYSATGNRFVKNNIIKNCSTTGLLAYNTTLDIINNNISNCQFGIQLTSNTNAKIKGSQSLPPIPNLTSTQYIQNNSSNQVYCSFSCFPTDMHYNIVQNVNNTNSAPHIPLVFYNPSATLPILFPLNVESNCWGNNFIPTDLYCSRAGVTYDSDPVFCLGDGDNLEYKPEEILYSSAENDILNNNFLDAESTLKNIIIEYPKSTTAPAALKELFRIQSNTDNNYSLLKEFFLTNDSIINDSTLKQVSNSLANKCSIKLEDWNAAISWFENEISNPFSVEDSIFAIIDLGELYQLIESFGYKSLLNSSMPQFKPSSNAAFVDYRDYLLDLIPIIDKADAKDNNLTESGQVLYNRPNPFSHSTEIIYNLDISADIKIVIHDLSGRVILSHEELKKGIGLNKFFLQSELLVPGIYEYSLFVNGKLRSTKKMIAIN